MTFISVSIIETIEKASQQRRSVTTLSRKNDKTFEGSQENRTMVNSDPRYVVVPLADILVLAGTPSPMVEPLLAQAINRLMGNFGVLIQFLRLRSRINQRAVVATLTRTYPMDQVIYSRIEHDLRVPTFAELPLIYEALVHSGAIIQPEERIAYLCLAKARIEAKGTHQEHIPEAEWEKLAAQLLEIHEQGGKEEKHYSVHRATLL